MKILKILLAAVGITLLVLGFTNTLPLAVVLFTGYLILAIPCAMHIKKSELEQNDFGYGMSIILCVMCLFNAIALFPRVIEYLG